MGIYVTKNWHFLSPFLFCFSFMIMCDLLKTELIFRIVYFVLCSQNEFRFILYGSRKKSVSLIPKEVKFDCLS